MVRTHPAQPEKSTCASKCFFLSNPKDWYVITTQSCMESPQAYGITRQRVFVLRIDAIHHFVMIPYGTSCQFHTATSCGFHTRLRRDWDAEKTHQNRGQIRDATPYESTSRTSRIRRLSRGVEDVAPTNQNSFTNP